MSATETLNVCLKAMAFVWPVRQQTRIGNY